MATEGILKSEATQTGEKKKRGQATKRDEQSRNGAASSSVSELRRNDISIAKPDVSGGVRLPRVQSSDSDSESEEVRSRPAKVEESRLMTLEEMSLSERITLLNALRDLPGIPKKLKGIAPNTRLSTFVLNEYSIWLESLIRKVLGGVEVKQNADVFTKEEIQSLKMMAARVNAKVNAPAAGANTGQQQHAESASVPRPPYQSQQKAPLKEAVDTESLTKAQRMLLSELEKLDRSFDF